MVVSWRQFFRLVSTKRDTEFDFYKFIHKFRCVFVRQTSAGAVVLTDVVFWLVIVPFLSNTHLGLNTVRTFIESLGLKTD